MLEPYHSQYLEPGKSYRRFSLLLCIKKNPHITQKKLGHETCLSSAMVNNYIKELTREGLIKVSGKSNRDMAYHLTPEGRVYMSDNFLAFSAEIVQFYASVRREIVEILSDCYNEGIRTIVLYGAADTAEIVYSAIQKAKLVVIGVVDNDPEKIGTLFFGMIIKSPSEINEIQPDALIITSFARQYEILEALEDSVDKQIKVKVISRF